MFVVADQAPVQYQGPERLLHPPPFRLRNESPLLSVAPDDLDVDAEGGPMHDDLVLEALVDQGLAGRAAGRDSDLVEQSDAGALSWTLAATTVTAMTRPRTSTASPRLRPGTRFAGSLPVVTAGTPVAARTL